MQCLIVPMSLPLHHPSFSRGTQENELRSRVFAERLGLECGWNCHISLASSPCDPVVIGSVDDHQWPERNLTDTIGASHYAFSFV